MLGRKTLSVISTLLTIIALIIGYLIATPAPPSRLPPAPTIPVVTPTGSVNGVSTTQFGYVQKVIDGDTIELDTGEKVRYIGIDTPETTRGDCFAQEAKQLNKTLVERKMVRLEKDTRETDDYGRLLRYVYLEGTLINKYLVASGAAKSKQYPPDTAKAVELEEAQKEAKDQLRGLWRVCAAGVVATAAPSPTGSCILKGNISREGKKLLHIPGCQDYNLVTIDTNRGEQWFCTTTEALNAGWVIAGNCP